MEKFKEVKLTLSITVKSTKGFTIDEITDRIMEMEFYANQKGNPRFHFTALLTIPE